MSSVEKYMQSDDLKYFYKCTKEELIELAGRYNISLKMNLKEDMQVQLLDELTKRGNDDKDLEERESLQTASCQEEEMESEQFKLEKLRLEMEFRIQCERMKMEN